MMIRRRIRPRALCMGLSLVTVLALPRVAVCQLNEGPMVRGSASLVFYHTGEGSDLGQEGTEEKYRFLERLRLRVSDLAPGLSFMTALTGRHRIEGSGHPESELRFHQSYLEYRGQGRWRTIRLRLGRHPIYGLGATGLTDGLSLTLKHRWMQIGSFVGAAAAENLDELEWPKFDRSRWWGISGSTSPFRYLQFSASYNQLRRGGVDERELLTGGIEAKPLRGVRILYEHRHDFALERIVGKSLLASWRPNARRELWGKLSRRRPELPASSFFANFRELLTDQRTEIRGGGRSALSDDLDVSGSFAAIGHRASFSAPPAGSGADAREPDEWSLDGGVTVLWRGQSIGYFAGRGYGGDRDGLRWSIGRRLSRRLHVGLDGNLLDYTYGTGEQVEDEVATLRGRVEADLGPQTLVMVQLEYLSNRVNSEDLRVLLRVRRGFQLGG